MQGDDGVTDTVCKRKLYST